jgi:hypothetical protein
MTEVFILDQIPKRMRQLGYRNWHTRYRELTLLGNSRISIFAYNELWFIVDNPVGLIVDSDYGVYDSTGNSSNENTHQHKGGITIENPESSPRKVTFIQVIIVN